MDVPETRRRAVLLVGPTGSGKTPLGDLIAERGLWGQPCVHFDFGANLRLLVEQDQPDGLLSRADLDFLREVLRSGVLLENRHFPLAERILRSFLAREAASSDKLVVLNGLPRHVGQAEAVARLLTLEAVVHLHCLPEVVLERIRTNVAGDRAGRADDELVSVRRKLRLFAQRTAPLVDHYRRSGAGVVIIDVTAAMTPADMWHLLDRCRPAR